MKRQDKRISKSVLWMEGDALLLYPNYIILLGISSMV